MGRIDLSSLNDGGNNHHSRPSSASANRGHISSPSLGSSNGPIRKAKVNMNSIGSSAGTPASNGILNSRPPLSNSSAFSSPQVRSPFQPSGFDPIAAQTNGERNTSVPQSSVFHVRSAEGSTSSSRTTTRSPSPSRLYSGAIRSANASSNSTSSLHSQNRGSESPSIPISKPRVRPASGISSHEGALSGMNNRTVTPTFNAKVTNPSYDHTPTAKHARSNSYVTPFARNAFQPAQPAPSQRSKSRSPSPIFARSSYGKEGRRISHGSNVSAGGQSSTSGTQNNSVGRSSFTTAPKRPSLTAMSTQFGNFSVGDSSTGTPANNASLESPSYVPSPSANGPITSPTTHGSLPSPGVLLSPAVELDAEQVEAKTNRKILDLEITNKSLLAINGGLEVTKLKQAREIRELKKRLREGRTLGDTLGIHDREGDDVSESDVEDGESVSDEEAPLNTELEEAHQRCKGLIDAMVLQARQAILSKYESEVNHPGNRVLHPAEIDAMQNEIEIQTNEEGMQSRPIDDAQTDSEEEGEEEETSRLPDITSETSISQEADVEGEDPQEKNRIH